MEFSGSAASGRRAAMGVFKRFQAILASILLATLAWSGAASAQSCDLVVIGASSQSGPTGSTLTFEFAEDTGACVGNADGTITVTSDSTGGAIVAPTTFNIPIGTNQLFTVDLGPTPGGTGTVLVNCLDPGCPASSDLTYSFATTNNFVFVATTPTSITTNEITNNTFGVNLQMNGAPSTIPVTFTRLPTTNIGTVTPDALGDASINHSIAVDGTYTVRATLQCPVAAPIAGCTAVPPVDFTVVVEPVTITHSDPVPVVPSTIGIVDMLPGDTVPVEVRFGSPSLPAPDGNVLNWNLTQAPGGDGALAGPTATTGGAGLVPRTFTATVPGTYTIDVGTFCTFCGGPVQIQVNVLATGITVEQGDGQAGLVGVAYPVPLIVAAFNGTNPAVGAPVTWSSPTGNATFAPGAGTTDAGGETQTVVTPTGPGTVTVRATRTDTGDFVDFTLTAETPTILINTGDGQSGVINTPLPTNLGVIVRNNTNAAGGVTVNWTVLTGTATIVPGAPTDPTGGMTSAQVTPTSVGAITIRAERQDAPGVFVDFAITGLPLPTMTAVTPNPATATVAVAQAFTVNVDQGGPLVGATVSWTANAPFAPATSTSTTDAGGDATASFTPSAAGSFLGAVTATYDPDGTPLSGDEVSISFNANVSTVPGLTLNSGDAQTGTVGTAFAQVLSVTADNSGAAAAGVTINWTQTAAVPWTLTASGATDAAGEAHLSVTPTSPGSNTITAERADAPGTFVTFTLSATAAATTVTAVTPDPAAMDVGVGEVFTVHVEQAGLPLAGATVSWTGIPGFTMAATSTTDINGDASVTVTAATAGSYAGAVSAGVNPDGIAASGDEASHAFAANVANVPTLGITGGNGQAGTIGVAYPIALAVLAQDNGTAPAAPVTINWTVGPGSATLAATTTTDAAGASSQSVTPTSNGPITITAERADAPGVLVTFSLTAAFPKTLTAVTPNPASGSVGAPMTFTVVLEQGGVPVVGSPISWSAAAPFTPGALPGGTTDANGESSVTVTPNAAGNFPAALAAVYDPDGVAGNGDELDVHFDVNTAVVRTLTLVAGDGQSTPAGSAFAIPLEVLAADSGTPVNGLTINWTVVGTSPATITGSTPTDAAGSSTATVSATGPGAIQIRAERSDDPTVFQLFNLNATAAPFVLTAASANPASGTVGVAIPVSVSLTQLGVPVAGASISWAPTGPFSVDVASSATAASGQASVNLTPSAAGTYATALTATYDPDGIAGNGDEVSVVYGAQVAFVAALAITGGDAQAALPGTTFPQLLEVHASNSGVPAAGLGITWTVVGDATVAPFGPTDAAGNASATVTAGATPGAVTVTAARADDPTVNVQFTLNVDAFGTLTIVSGNGQMLTAGVPSDLLEVELKNAAGAPIAGAVVGWSTTAGTLANPTSTTNAAGIASNTVTVAVAGAVDVTASSPLAGAPAVFSMKGGLANLAGLDPIQEQVAEALDNLCPALAALPSPTPEQADLLARCEELIDAGGIDPAATIIAIDELMTEVALAQGSASLLAAQAQFQNLKVRIAALRAGTVGTSFGGLALNTPTGAISLETLSTAFTAEEDPAAPAAGTEVGADFSRWGFFAAGNIGRGESDGSQNEPEFDYDIDGITVGVDYRHSDKWIFGAAFGYTRQDTALPGGRGSVDTNGWSLSAYTTYYQADSWYVDGVLTWGRNDFGLMRRIDYTVPLPGGGTSTVSQVARSDTGGDLLSGGFTVGRDFNRGAFGIGPYARLLYTRLGFDEINEELISGQPGSGLGLSIEEREVTSLASVIGTKFTYTHSTDWGVVIPHLQLEWEHEFRDDPQSLQARFLNDPTNTPIIVTGDAVDTNYFRIGLGLSMVLTKGRSGFLYYEHLIGRDGMSQYNLALGLRLEF